MRVWLVTYEGICVYKYDSYVRVRVFAAYNICLLQTRILWKEEKNGSKNGFE